MSHGFKTGNSQADSAIIRKPTEGEFKAWLPTVGFPFPFKADAGGVTELVVSDSYIANVADAVTLEQEHSLQVADSYVANVTDEVTLSVELALSVSDSTIVNVSDVPTIEEQYSVSPEDTYHAQHAESVVFEAEGTLAVDDSTVINVADAVGLQVEHQLEVNSAYSEQAADGNAAFEQEQNLSVSDSDVINESETPLLEVFGDKLLVVEDAANANESDTVTVEVIAAPVAVKKGGRFRPVYFFPQPLPKEEKPKEEEVIVEPEVYALQVQDGIVQTTAETVAVYEVVSLRVLDGKARVINIAPVDIRYYRSKRKIQEDELLLMAA